MKRKLKCGLFAVLAAGLLTAVLVACMNPASPASVVEPGAPPYVPPAGMGAVRLSVNSTVARTIMPTDILTTGTTGNYIQSYLLEIYDEDNGGAPVSPLDTVTYTDGKFPAANIGDSIVLPIGIYKLTITAFLDGIATQALDVAIAEDHEFIVAAGGVYDEEVTLKAFDPITGIEDGKFSWKISFSADPEEADMYITEIGGTRGLPIDLTDSANLEDDDDITEGYYWVDFELEYADGAEIAFRQVLHVYRNLTSHLEHEFVYEPYGGGFTFVVDPFSKYPPQLTFGGTATGNGLPATPVLLYLDSPAATRTITVNNLDDYDGEGNAYDSVEWYIGSTEYDDSDPHVSGTDSEIFTANVANAPFNAVGTYILTVVGYDEDGAPHASFVYIKVEAEAP